MSIAVLLASALAAQAPAPGDATVEAAYAEMADGRSAAAIEKLQQTASDTDHPARLINLAIAHARMGETDKARALLEAASGGSDRLWLETASGDWVDSRTVARKAIAMLERGEFSSPQFASR